MSTGNLGRKEGLTLAAAGLAGVLLMLTGWEKLFISGPLDFAFREARVISMWAELAAVFVLLLLSFRIPKRKYRYGAVVFICGLFLWLHQIFLPAAVSGIYFLWLYFFGKWQLVLFFSGRKGRIGDRRLKPSMCFLTGSCAWILFVCIMSLLGIGSIRILRLCFMALLAVTVMLEVLERWKSLKDAGKKAAQGRKAVEKAPGTWLEAFLMAFIFTMVLMQFGRANIALDYDSLHYGLRTPYILNNGGGIYENLGNINLVYTYSKGLEVLVMPLAGTATYGYVLGFSMWTAAAVLGWAYRFVSKYRNHFYGILAAAVLSGIPGIMNMGITAKTDCITLLFQMFLLEEGVEAVVSENREERGRVLLAAFSFCIFTYVLKPTALVFSTALFGCLVLMLLWKRPGISFKGSCWQTVILSLLVLFFIWRRTWLLTGYPVTSVFTGIWELLGFHVKEPFAFGAMPSQGIDMSFGDSLKLLASRLFGVFAAPVGEDMDHVIIAWGTWLIPWLLLLIVVFRTVFRRERKEKEETRVLLGLTGIFSLLSLITLYLLWQVDGNYYMIYYALTVVTAVLLLGDGRKSGSWKKAVTTMLLVLMVGAGAVSTVTNWAGARGLTPVKVVHKGYYNHLQEAYDNKVRQGSEAIWNILAQDAKTRVLAFGEHPGVLNFPCNVQSYYDLTGSGGNVYMVKKLDYFKDFLRYAKIEYIYVERGYLDDQERAAEIIRYMQEDGSLTDCVYEHDNMLGKVRL